MGEKKRGLIVKEPNIKALKEAKLLDNTINFLSNKQEKLNFDINETTQVHDAVKKMQNTNFKELDPRNTDERWRKIEEARTYKNANSNSLEKWEESKKAYTNNHKLASEHENELQREQVTKIRKKILNSYKNLDELNKKAEEIYKNVSLTNVLKIIKNN